MFEPSERHEQDSSLPLQVFTSPDNSKQLYDYKFGLHWFKPQVLADVRREHFLHVCLVSRHLHVLGVSGFSKMYPNCNYDLDVDVNSIYILKTNN